MSEALLTPKEAAKSLRICERMLRTLKTAGQLPFVQIGRAVRYDPADLRVFIERQKIAVSTS